MQPAPGVVSLQVWCPLGHWDVCSWPQGSQAPDAVMDEGILSLPCAACGPGQVIPSVLHAFSMATLKTGS